MPPKGLIFDFNGVLVDDEQVHYRLFHDLLARRGFRLTEHEYYNDRYFVLDDAGVFMRFFADHHVTLTPEALSALCDQKAALYAALPEDHFQYFEGSIALARDAARHVPLGIASGARGAEIRRHLELKALGPLFRAVISIDEVKRGKPDPEVFLAAARGIGVSPAECVAIEDSPGGLQAARAAGMQTIGLTHTLAADKLPADVVLPTLEGLTWADLVARIVRRPGQP